MPCPFTLQVPKCFRLVQIFCARSKSYLHFWRGTKCSPIFGLAQKIWTGTKRFGTCNRTRQKRVCLTYISTVVWLALGLYKMGLRVPQRPETQAAGPTWSSLLILRRIQECYSRNVFNHRKVASSSMPWLVAYPHIFRMFMKGKIWSLYNTALWPNLNSRPVYCSRVYGTQIFSSIID